MLTYAILGPLEVRRDGQALPLQGQRQRVLVALLLLHPNEVVPKDRLIDCLWGERPPPTAATSLHNTISQLRKLLGPDALETRPLGYVLAVEPAQLDLLRFEELARHARTQATAGRASTLREALALWRGEPLADLAFESFAQAEIRRLQELRVGVLEERIDADLEIGPSGDLVAELEALVDEFPLRETLRSQLMLALYRTGRQAEALQAFHNARRTLVDGLGIEPGRPLQQLFGRILRQERVLEPGGEPRSEPDALDEIARAIVAGRLVPVVGTAHAGLPLPELAESLATRFDYPDEGARDLTKVAQFVSITHGAGPLYDELHAIFDRPHDPSPLDRFLSSLPAILRERAAPQQLIVTTAWDNGVEQAFRDAGEALDVVAYLALGRDRGKFMHRSADGETKVIQLPNAYAEVPLGERAVLLKIHGGVGQAPARDWESFAVSEDDFIGYLAESGISGALPVTLAACLRRSHFLFLGYSVLDWHLRVFLNRLWPDAPIGYRSWAVQPDPAGLERAFWRPRGVEPVRAEVDAYVGLLQERVGAIGA